MTTGYHESQTIKIQLLFWKNKNINFLLRKSRGVCCFLIFRGVLKFCIWYDVLSNGYSCVAKVFVGMNIFIWFGVFLWIV